MNKSLLFLFTLIVYFQLSAQEPIGLHHDADGTFINGFFDPMAYSPETKLSKIHNAIGYEPGYYYDTLGLRHPGFIKFEEDKIFYRVEKDDYDKVKLTPETVKGFVVGVDSFFVIKDYKLKKKADDRPEFAQYITEYNDMVFVKHYHFTTFVAQSYANRPPVVINYLVKTAGESEWDNLTDNFKEQALKYFGHNQHLAFKIGSGKYNSEDLMQIIKTEEYLIKFNNADRIPFDDYWQETYNADKSGRYAIIDDIQDSIWTMTYFDDGLKLYSVDYSSFYPHVKQGNFVSFYPDGKVREERLYKKNELKQVKSFNEKGQLYSSYMLMNEGYPKFSVVNNEDGTNAMTSIAPTTIKVTDPFTNKEYFSEYANNELRAFYRVENGNETHHVVKDGVLSKVKLKTLKNNFNYLLSDKDYDRALMENATGYSLILLSVGTNGKVFDSKVLNQLHPEIDQIVRSFAESLAGFKVKTLKIDDVKCSYEFVLPIEFGVERFYRPQYQYNWYMHDQFMHQHMQQVMMQQSIQNIPVPTFPSGF